MDENHMRQLSMQRRDELAADAAKEIDELKRKISVAKMAFIEIIDKASDPKTEYTRFDFNTISRAAIKELYNG